MDVFTKKMKQRQIDTAIYAAKVLIVRLRAMKRDVRENDAVSINDWRKAVALDLNDLNYKAQTL